MEVHMDVVKRMLKITGYSALYIGASFVGVALLMFFGTLGIALYGDVMSLWP